MVCPTKRGADRRRVGEKSDSLVVCGSRKPLGGFAQEKIMEDYSERNLQIIEEAMQELGISDCEEIPAAIRLLKQQCRPTKRVLDLPSAVVEFCNPVNGVHAAWCPDDKSARK
jgi:hypothetical protein